MQNARPQRSVAASTITIESAIRSDLIAGATSGRPRRKTPGASRRRSRPSWHSKGVVALMMYRPKPIPGARLRPVVPATSNSSLGPGPCRGIFRMLGAVAVAPPFRVADLYL